MILLGSDVLVTICALQGLRCDAQGFWSVQRFFKVYRTKAEVITSLTEYATWKPSISCGNAAERQAFRPWRVSQQECGLGRECKVESSIF